MPSISISQPGGRNQRPCASELPTTSWKLSQASKTFIGQRINGDTQINVAPDGSPIFTRDTGYQEIYALNIRWP